MRQRSDPQPLIDKVRRLLADANEILEDLASQHLVIEGSMGKHHHRVREKDGTLNSSVIEGCEYEYPVFWIRVMEER